MTESIVDAFKCNQCGAEYASEKELVEHEQSAHHATNRNNLQQTSESELGKTKVVNQRAKAKAKNA